jgi:hypothetical protein
LGGWLLRQLDLLEPGWLDPIIVDVEAGDDEDEDQQAGED